MRAVLAVGVVAPSLLAATGVSHPGMPLGLPGWAVSFAAAAAVLMVAGVMLACAIRYLGRSGPRSGLHRIPDDWVGELMWTQVRMRALIGSTMDGMAAIEAGRLLPADAVRVATDASGAFDSRWALDNGGGAGHRAPGGP